MADSFTWDPIARRYRGPTGAFVPDAAVRQAVDAVVDGSAERLAGLTQRLTAGALDLATWQQQMAAELKAVHLATITAGHGGWAQMSPADWGWAGQRLRQQYAYLRDWATALAAGTAPLDGRAGARARLYGDAARQSYEELRRRDGRLGGDTEERRVRRASESCAGCRAEAGRGWQPAGTLAPLGSQQCRSRCKCVWQTRQVRRAAA
jgi:hypothetical protein